jgi:hypothetical protein
MLALRELARISHQPGENADRASELKPDAQAKEYAISFACASGL